MSKRCTGCNQTKPFNQFHKNAGRPGGYQPYCKPCTATKSFARRDAAAAYKRKREFGLSDEDYKQMLIAQQYVCAICHQPERQLRRGRLVALHVDHDHKTGKVRQLLCTKCNAGLGYFDDNPERMQQAAAYLEKHRDVQDVSREL